MEILSPSGDIKSAMQKKDNTEMQSSNKRPIQLECKTTDFISKGIFSKATTKGDTSFYPALEDVWWKKHHILVPALNCIYF